MLRIGQLAKTTGFNPKTLRYYEEVGLLRPSARSDSGYRLYTDEVVERLRFVQRAQGLGLSLDDIRRILSISDEGRVPCEHVISVIDRELEKITGQMQRLDELQNGLAKLRSRISDALAAGTVRPGECPCFENGEAV